MKLKDLLNNIKPNAEREWEEAQRYPELVELGKEEWLKLVANGKQMKWSSLGKVGNVDKNLKHLKPTKLERAKTALASKNIEMSIVGVWPDGYKDLIAGNTRLAIQLNNRIDPVVWVVNIPVE